MSTSVTLPALGESVTEGTVSRWLKQVGDTVEADEPLLEVSTDKVDTEIPSPTSGVLLEIKAQEDETVEVGAVLAVIGDASEAGGDSGGGDSGGEDASGEYAGGGRGCLGSARRGAEPESYERRAGAGIAAGRAEGRGLRTGTQFGGRIGERHRRHPSGPWRERHRRHGEPLAQAGR